MPRRSTAFALCILAWTTDLCPALTLAPSHHTLSSLMSAYPAVAPQINLATTATRSEYVPRPRSTGSAAPISTLSPRNAKKESIAQVAFAGLTLSAFPPNWCGFVSGKPDKFVTCHSTETCAILSSDICCAIGGSCARRTTACVNRPAGVTYQQSTSDGTLFCDSPSQYCQKLSYGTQATLLQCAEHSEDGELVPASNLLSACSGLNLYYRGAETGEGYTFDGIYKQESTSESTKAIETTATQPVVALDYVSSLGGHPPSCAADIEEACPAIWADMQWAWNTSRPSDYYCGNLLLHSCSEVCLDGNLSPWRYRNWVTRVCKGYLNTYNHHKRRQDFRRHWSAFEPLSEAVYPGLFPWKWRVVNDDMENNNATTQGEQCPSSSAKLGSLAVINILLLFVAMLQSRRTLVQRLTFGKCGKRGSTLWPLMGLISFVLNLTSDLINAVLVHNTPGYGHVPVGSLVLLWSSRPRMAWVAILLVNVQSRDSVYLGSAASAALAETLMQLVGLAYVGRTANYAHQNGLFSASKLANVPHGADATLMYRGAVLVLVAVGFAVLSLLVIIRAMRKNIISRLKGCASGRGTEQSEQETAIPLADLSARRPVADELRKMRLEDDHVPLVYRFAIYMVPLFIGQWLFWAGFIKLAGDLYCPPDVWRITGIWAGFASVGLLFGSAG